MAGILQNNSRQFFLRFAPRLALLLLVVALGAQLAHWTWVLFAPRQGSAAVQAAPADVAAAGRIIAATHLFGHSTQPVAALDRDGAALNIRLKGVFAARGRSPSFAIINTGAKGDLAVRAGDEVQPGLKLQSVHSQYIVVNHDGALQRINLEQKDRTQAPSQLGATRLGISSVGYNAYSISRSDLTAALQGQDFNNNASINLGKLGTAPGGGLQVMEASSGSIAEKLGLQAGDVLRQINGQYVSSSADLSRMYQQLQQVSQIQLELVRSGKPIQLRYTVQQ
jgi:general secretion pathway protein C